jgi:hypothetical protein
MSKITHSNLDQLKKVRSLLTSGSSIDNKIANTVHIKQILKDIDALSSFSHSISTELIGLQTYRDNYQNFSTITSVVDSAVRYYEEELKSL